MRPYLPVDEHEFLTAVRRRARLSELPAALAWLREQEASGVRFVSVGHAVHTWRLRQTWGTRK